MELRVPATIFMIFMTWVNLIKKKSVKTKCGSKDQYIEAVNAVKANGIQAMIDVVLNPKAGGDEAEKIKVVLVNTNDRSETISDPFDENFFALFILVSKDRLNLQSELVGDARLLI